MQINPLSGLLENVRYVASPNTDQRPSGTVIDLLVIHAISLPAGEFGGPWIEQLFCNRLQAGAHPDFAEICQLKVSAHVLIRRDGEVVQYVPFAARAWHAGVSSFCGREQCNDFSIGIELEGCDQLPFTPVQYQQLARLCHCLMHVYPGITPQRIVGHSDIAPQRKTDPGPLFDWQRLHRLLEQEDSGLHSRA
jgi:AmpD protein